jgi:hypothetical protein
VQLHQPNVLEQVMAFDAHLLVVSFAPLDRLGNRVPYFRRTMLALAYRQRQLALPAHPFARTTFLADPDRNDYTASGLGRNSVLRVYGPRILWRYLRWSIEGKPIKINGDTLQRGGDFVVGRNGRLMLAHTGRDQADRPPISAILAALGRV